jgi:hypothetical protein
VAYNNAKRATIKAKEAAKMEASLFSWLEVVEEGASVVPEGLED